MARSSGLTPRSTVTSGSVMKTFSVPSSAPRRATGACAATTAYGKLCVMAQGRPMHATIAEAAHLPPRGTADVHASSVARTV